MCGIIGIVSRPFDDVNDNVPSAAQLLEGLDRACAAADAADLVGLAREVESVDASLHGLAGVLALVGHPEAVAGIEARLALIEAALQKTDATLEAEAAVAPDELEATAAALIAARDAVWAVRNDRLRTAREVDALAGADAGPAAVAGYLSVQQGLSAIDRLEVRGRDSAGVHLFVWGHGLRADDPTASALLAGRTDDPLFQNGSVRWTGDTLGFVYKAAAEVGELGDNTRALREAIAADPLLRLALAAPAARLSLLGHTRWASVGIISEPNAHPINSEESGGGGRSYVVGALNGDVDNHADIKVLHDLHIPGPITTDAKVIPSVVSRMADTAGDIVEAFRRTVAGFEGSVAIAAMSADQPNRMLLALRGSGQGLYIGLAADRFVVASEPYGLVEETLRYVRLDGETPASEDQASSRGQIAVLDGDAAGSVAGVRVIAYDGSPIEVSEADVCVAEVTTRDIDRGEHPHFLLKEITEAPESFRKTLRGKIVEREGTVHAVVGERALPAPVAAALASGEITRVRVIGQGTAAVAGRSLADTLDGLCEGVLDVDALTATELSGFGLRMDMRDTLIVAVSQSGTTTDTNRTVDLARARGARVIGIVNRRNSDLTDKSDGVLYTSDGRDVEMSVASTKAFYAQVAAGVLLACAIAEAAQVGRPERRHAILQSLRTMPDAMRAVIELRPTIAEAAHRFAPTRRYWAVVGNGPNAIAAHEVRIKLSELCYKSIACDVTEDKKHIDLSAEPLILVCAAGLTGSTADDVAKEVAIYRAHKAVPIVVATEGDARFSAAAHVVAVPMVDPALAFVLSAMVGHLFGYEAALAIDALARPLREAREVIDHAVSTGDSGEAVLADVRVGVAAPAERFFDGLRSAAYDGCLEASTAVRLVGLLRDLLSDAPLERHQIASGKVSTPAVLVDDLTAALTRAIEELTRPVDAIKHQAKTVTVGISRSDEGILDRALVRELLATGAGRDLFTYRTLKVLADLDPAVDKVIGFIRYRIDGAPAPTATISIVDRGGIANDIPSRVERNNQLLGTKRRVANEREVLVAKGRSDGRTFILVPEAKSGAVTGITLLHVQFHDTLQPAVARGVLQGYDRRYDRLVDWVTETESAFRDDLLAEVPVVELLTLPISDVADRWRG